MKLTLKQQQAVESAGSVAITAGAGTGKTAMLAARFVHHVVIDGFSPLEIAAVTFTEKAAAELRSRIREELVLDVGEDLAAETDAAQISTIHSLAARICRDFYDVAGIPPDFRMLDETDAEILLADWFDNALAEIEPDVVTRLGYTWLRDALRELFKDPPAADEALKFDRDQVQELVSNECEKAIAGLIGSDCWHVASDVLSRFHGTAGDKLEEVRAKVLSAMADITSGQNNADAFNAFKGFRSDGGAAKNWPAGLADVRNCLVKLKDAFRNCGEIATLEFGEADVELSRRTALLRRAFASVTDFLRRAKLEKRILDFSDLEYYALNALHRPEVRRHYSERWKAILVDEFQDTNPVQEKILQALTENGARLTIVGDDKQSIYGFRRADPRVFERFRKSIGNNIALDRTFRTHAGLVSPLNVIFESVLGGMHQPLEAERIELPHQGPFIEAHSFCDDGYDVEHLRRMEAGFIANEIHRLLESGLQVWDKSRREHRAVRPSDIAILSRTRAPLEVYIDKLTESGIPAVNTGGGNLLETSVAKDMTALLRFFSDPSDDIALVSLLRGPLFAASDICLYELSRERERDESWWHLVLKTEAKLNRERTILIDLLENSKRFSAERMLEIADEKTGYTAVIANLEQGDRRMGDWFGFLALLRKFASLGRSDVVGAYRYLKSVDQAGSVIPRPPVDAGNAVSLMTIHAAKGLEWPVVFVPNLSAHKKSDSPVIRFDSEMGVGFKVILKTEDGTYEREEPAIYKLIKAKKQFEEQQESGRILYVAMTRARDRLYLTSAGKPGNEFSLLAPALEAAGIEIQTHGASYQTPAAGKIPQSNGKPDFHIQLARIA